MRTLVVLLSGLTFAVRRLLPAAIKNFIPFLFFSFKCSILTLKDFRVFPNKKVFSMNYTIWDNDGLQTYTTNSTYEVFQPVTRLTLFITIKIPKTPADKNFQKVFFKTSVDVEKTVSGIQNNYITSAVVDNLFSSHDGLVRFPIPKVSHVETLSDRLEIHVELSGRLPSLQHKNQRRVHSNPV
jgi:hypothetical protein